MLVITTTSNESSSAPQNAKSIVITFPGTVPGEISPYPIVVSVMTVNQTALKYESKTSSLWCRKYSISKILTRYAEAKTVPKKKNSTVGFGYSLRWQQSLKDSVVSRLYYLQTPLANASENML